MQFVRKMLGIPSCTDDRLLGMDLEVLPLHKHPHYKEACCELLNDEWRRSTTARMHSLNSSCDKLPTNLILLKGTKLIGHCKLSLIPSMQNACFIESVVIDKNLRGNGYGKYLMISAEEFCKSTLNLKMIYLSTTSQEIFYTKLGYNMCQPISIYGGYPSKTIPSIYSHYNNDDLMKNQKNTNRDNLYPGPPPMPEINSTRNSKIYMNKIL